MRIAMVTAADGRVVELDQEAWDHVVTSHPEFVDGLEEVISALTNADVIEPDPRPGRQRYYLQLTASRWLRVVTEFGGDSDRFVTAFEQSNLPRGRRLR